jgi:hypothetical protein
MNRPLPQMKRGRMFLIMVGTASLLPGSGLFSCNGEPEMEPVMTLYDKPLSTIKKVIEGKWKVYSNAVSGVEFTVDYPESVFVEFKKDHYVFEKEGNRRTVYFTWKKLPIANWRDPLKGYETYIIWNQERNDGDYYFRSISNDTLSIGGYIIPGGSRVVRIKQTHK